MYVNIPTTISDSTLASCSIAENDHSEWDASTTYNKNDRVILTSTHSIYESRIDSNLGNDPKAAGSTSWLRISATNRWKAFDQKIGAQAVGASQTETYSFSGFSSPVDSVACFGLSGTTVQLVVTDPTDGEVYNQTISLIDNGLVGNMYDYYFSPILVKTEAVFNGIPPYASATFTLTFTAATGEVPKIGQIVMGREYALGITTYGTSVSIEDFSKKEQDGYGDWYVVEGAFSKLIDYSFVVETSLIRRAAVLLESVRATPAVFHAGADTEQYGATVFGFFDTWKITADGPSISGAKATIKGLS